MKNDPLSRFNRFGGWPDQVAIGDFMVGLVPAVFAVSVFVMFFGLPLLVTLAAMGFLK